MMKTGRYSVQAQCSDISKVRRRIGDTSPRDSFRGFPCSKVISCPRSSLWAISRSYLEIHVEKSNIKICKSIKFPSQHFGGSIYGD